VVRTKDTTLAERNRRIVLLRRNGLSYSEIADMEGISRVRVGQIVAATSPDIPEEEARAEIATLLEFAENRCVHLITNPGFKMSPNGQPARGPDGEPAPDTTVIDSAIRTLVAIADRKARLLGADKPPKKPQMSPEEALAAYQADIAQRTAKLAEEDRQRAVQIAHLEQLQRGHVIRGEIEPPEAAAS
jgi:hypothetical protein